MFGAFILLVLLPNSYASLHSLCESSCGVSGLLPFNASDPKSSCDEKSGCGIADPYYQNSKWMGLVPSNTKLQYIQQVLNNPQSIKLQSTWL